MYAIMSGVIMTFTFDLLLW